MVPASSRVGRVPIRTYAPDVGSDNGGVVLLHHGLRSDMDSLDREARILARSGTTVVLVDAPHHGARKSVTVEAMPDTLTREGHRTVIRLICEARDEIPRLVDHFHALGRPKVAIGGVSFGGFIALAAATIEPRLVAIVSILGSPDWTPVDGVVPDDLVELVADSPLRRYETFAPRPVLLINGARDENVPPGPARELARLLRPIYDGTRGGPLVHREYPAATHFPSDADWADMWSTTAKFLGDAFANG